MAESRRIRIAPILLEAGFVVLGVFLALVANEWRANANARAHAASARATIVEEVRSNREAIAASRDYHERIFDSLRVRMPPGSPAPPPDLFSEGFIHTPTTLRTAWDAASATDAVSYMDYGDVLTFSKLYALLDRYEQAGDKAGSVIFSEIMERGVPGVAANYRNLIYLIGSMLYLERGLIAEYDSVLARIDSTGA